MFGKYCRRAEQSFWTQGVLWKRGIPKKGLVFATKLEQYTCIRLINYLTHLDSFSPKYPFCAHKNSISNSKLV